MKMMLLPADDCYDGLDDGVDACVAAAAAAPAANE